MHEDLDEIHLIREQQLTRGIHALAILGFFTLMGSLSRIFYVGWHNIMYLHIALYLVVLATALLRGYLSFLFRASIILSAVFVLGIAALASWGLAGFGMAALLAFCILSTMLFGTRAGIISSVISLVAIGIIGSLVVSGILTFKFNPDIYLTSFGSWMASMFGILISAGLIVVALGTMNRQLSELVETLEERNMNLLEANRQLEREIREHNRVEKERRQLETRLQRAQKMEIMATLAGGVAHDLNNILAASVSYPELLLMQIRQDSPLRKPLETIKNSGIKAAAIVHDLLTLARRGVATAEVTNLNRIISEYLSSPEFEKVKSYHPEVDIEIHLEENLVNTHGFPVHLMKTLMNLVSNAAEAMPNGGKLFIRTENRYVSYPIKGYDEIEPGNYAVLVVSDTGKGISSEDMDRIFEPFYTKKVMGRSGTGLGLAVVWGTVKDHKGHMDVKSLEGLGTTFTLYFPMTRKPLPQIRPPLSVKEYRGRGESILVVDDVKEQREIAFRLLSELGYSVTTVPSGEKAVEYLKHRSVDLIILDMIMEPGMDGLTTYKKILELHPGQKAIIASGYSETDRVKKAQRLGAGAYLKKPYLMEKVGLAVRTALEKA
jgi:signal transduction histidine kinase/ActR/RegA family two-component response regulator